jgi:hypothetical protein
MDVELKARCRQVAAGIPKHAIVLGFYSDEVRPFTDFAVA